MVDLCDQINTGLNLFVEYRLRKIFSIILTLLFVYSTIGFLVIHPFVSFYIKKRGLEQAEVAENETTTPGYSLVDVGVGTTFIIGNTPLNVTLSGTNIFNEIYINSISIYKISQTLLG